MRHIDFKITSDDSKGRAVAQAEIAPGVELIAHFEPDRQSTRWILYLGDLTKTSSVIPLGEITDSALLQDLHGKLNTFRLKHQGYKPRPMRLIAPNGQVLATIEGPPAGNPAPEIVRVDDELRGVRHFVLSNVQENPEKAIDYVHAHAVRNIRVDTSGRIENG